MAHIHTRTPIQAYTHACTLTMEYYSALKNKEILAPSTTQTEDTASSSTDNHKNTKQYNSPLSRVKSEKYKATRSIEANKGWS